MKIRGKNDPKSVALRAGLHYSAVTAPGLSRRKVGKGFRIVNAKGRPVRDPATLARVRKLAVPPAYRSVWINPDPQGHLQAVGIDARGRKQYRYHPKWTEATSRLKFDHVLDFARTLPKIRRATARDLRKPALPREKVLAAVVQLLEKTHIRVGNDEYAKSNRSYGLSTLKSRHVRIARSRVTFRFKGKSGVRHEIDLEDRRLARIVRECRELPGQELFQYVDSTGERCAIHSHDVNDYLRSISGYSFTAKDFRTWAGTVLAATLIRNLDAPRSKAEEKRALNAVIDGVAERLGNTRAVCRKSYIHPAVLDAFAGGTPVCSSGRSVERQVLRFLGRL